MITMMGFRGRPVRLKVMTSTILAAPPDDVWPLLVNSRMDRAPYNPVFALGGLRRAPTA